jgi:hypothetical protein
LLPMKPAPPVIMRVMGRPVCRLEFAAPSA